MNETLSSLIAFVGFLVVFSLLIQSVQEALKNYCKLKAGVWERFFINLYKEEFGKESEQPETPFWQRVKKGQFVGEFEQRILRLKTIVVKVDELLKEIRAILREINSIKPDSVNDVIELKVAALNEKLGQVRGLKLQTILKLYDEKIRIESGGKEPEGSIRLFSRELRELHETLGRRIEAVSYDFKSGLVSIQGTCLEVEKMIQRVEKSIATYRHQIENKADAWLVQLQGEYRKNMLKWTVYISIAAVLVLNADAFQIYRYFSVNAKAQAVMIETTGASVSAMETIQEKKINGIYEAIKEKRFNDARSDVAAMAMRFATAFKRFNDENSLSESNGIAEAAAALKGEPEPDFQELDELFGRLTRLYVIFQKSYVAYHMKTIEASGLPLGWGGALETLKSPGGGLSIGRIIMKSLGLLLTMFLVSFGAPFWQNIMNALIGLRSLTKKPEASGKPPL